MTATSTRRVEGGGFMLNRIIRKKQLADFVGLRRTAVDDAIKRGDFPRPIKIGPRAVGWLEEDIAQWQHGLIAKRDEAAASGRCRS
jgi:prophage regulatory protein